MTVPDDVYRRARIKAAEEGVSVSALVTQHLREIANERDEFADKLALQQRTISEVTRFRASERLSRDQVHDRAVR